MDLPAALFLLLAALAAAGPEAAVAGASPKPGSNITVMGTVFCDICANNSFSKHSYFLRGQSTRRSSLSPSAPLNGRALLTLLGFDFSQGPRYEWSAASRRLRRRERRSPSRSSGPLTGSGSTEWTSRRWTTSSAGRAGRSSPSAGRTSSAAPRLCATCPA